VSIRLLRPGDIDEVFVHGIVWTSGAVGVARDGLLIVGATAHGDATGDQTGTEPIMPSHTTTPLAAGEKNLVSNEKRGRSIARGGIDSRANGGLAPALDGCPHVVDNTPRCP
jgi:hypothetical protein